MKQIKLSNGLEIRAYVGDGFDGGSGVYITENRTVPTLKGRWGFPIPHKDLPKVIRLLAWYEKAEMSLRHWEGKMWRHISEDDYPALNDSGDPYQITFRRGHLESHLRKCGCKERK